MNSKVLNYLSEKKDNFMDWFEANKQSIKTNTTKVIATGLTLAALTNMIGCQNKDNKVPTTNNGGTSIETTPIPDKNFTEELPPLLPDLKPREEIERDGITAQDVIAAYDKLSTTALASIQFLSGEQQGVQFSTICTPLLQTAPNTAPMQLPFFPYYENENTLHIAHSPMNQFELSNVYEIGFGIDFQNTENQSNDLMQIVLPMAISKTEFDNMAKMFNVTSFVIDQQYVDNFSQNRGANINKFLNFTVQSSVIIDREFILNANEEQLWTLYNGIMSIINLNFGYLNSRNNLPSLDLDPIQ